MTQVRSKEEFVGSLDLVPSVTITAEENRTYVNGNENQVKGTTSTPVALKYTNGERAETDALISNQFTIPENTPHSVILVSSKQTQKGIMSIVGQTVLKIDSGKRMILVPNINKSPITTVLHPASTQMLQATDQSKQNMRAFTLGGQRVELSLEQETDTSVNDKNKTNSITSSSLVENQIEFPGKESNEKCAPAEYTVQGDTQANTGSNKKGDVELKELLRNDLRTSTDNLNNLNMLAHVSNQIFGCDQNIVYKKLTTEIPQVTKETKVCVNISPLQKIVPTDLKNAAVLHTLDTTANRNNDEMDINYIPILKSEPAENIGQLVVKTEPLTPGEDKLGVSQEDGIRKRKRRGMSDSGNWRGRRVGHPFNPNSLPPVAGSPACATCVLYEHTLLKMATRGFWGGNKGSLEDVFRSIRVEGTDNTDTVEDVTRRCYNFVRKKLLDLKEKRADAYAYMRSYIDEFDGFLERVPPVAVAAMIIYLPMAVDYELVTWHGVPPTGWSEYRRAVIMREVFEVLYHLGTQSNILPEYSSHFFLPRTQSKILKERLFDMREDESVKGYTVQRGAYHVLYSEKYSENDGTTTKSENVCDTTDASYTLSLPSKFSPNAADPTTSLPNESENSNNACPGESKKTKQISTQEEFAGGTEDSRRQGKRKSEKSETQSRSPKLRRTSRRRRTRNSTKDSISDELSDVSSLGCEEESETSQKGESENADEVSNPESAGTATQAEKPSVITPQFVENIVSACGNTAPWNFPGVKTEPGDSSVLDDNLVSYSPKNKYEIILQNARQSIAFESLWTKRAPDEPKVVMSNGEEKSFGSYLAEYGVETSCPLEKTLIAVNGVRYKASEVLGYFRRGVQFVEHTREHGTTIDTLTTMKGDIKAGAVRKIPPGKISKLVHPGLHLENYTAFILPLGISEGGSFCFKRKGFRHRLRRHRIKGNGETIEVGVKERDTGSPQKLYSSEVSSSTANEGKNNSDSQLMDTPDTADGEEKDINRSSPLSDNSTPPNYLPKEEGLASRVTLESLLKVNTSEETLRSRQSPFLLTNATDKECQAQPLITSEGIQTEAVASVLGHDLNVRLANSITDGIFKGFKKLLEEDRGRSLGNLSHLYSLQSLIDSYKKAGRFLLEMAENLETIMSSDTIQKT